MLLRRIQKLFDRRLTALEACEGFFSKHPPLVYLAQAVHTAIFSPTGGGKGVSLLIPHQLTNPNSMLVQDPKGENARITAEYRRKKFGHNIVLLDPFKVVTQTPDCFCPLQFINKEDPQAIDQCRDLANAFVKRTGEEREPHFNDSAESFIAACIATVVYYGQEEQGTRSLQAVQDILSSDEKLNIAIQLMCESDAWDGMLARNGNQLKSFIDREKMSTRTTVARHMRFLDTPAIAENTRTSTFNPADLRRGNMTVYLILPPDHMRAQAGLLRMWISSLLRACVREGLQS